MKIHLVQGRGRRAHSEGARNADDDSSRLKDRPCQMCCAPPAVQCVCLAECVERYLVANVGISNLTKHEINSDEKVASTQLSDFMAFRR